MTTKERFELEMQSGYICKIGKERVFIVAENIAQAMDKMEEIAGDDKYSMESHSSIRVIFCDLIK